MKKIKIFLSMLVMLFAFDAHVYAASTTISVSKSSVYVGDSFTVTANMTAAAAWNIHTSASGPVSGCVINQADASGDAMNTDKTFTANCTATGEGTITITLSGDITDEEGNNSGISGSKSVTVTTKPAPPSSSSSSSNNNNNNNNNNNKSTNNKLKELVIDGYKVTKVDDKNYTLSVNNSVTSVKVKVTAEDSKAKVTGDGEHKLNVGDNNIEIVITSESGAQNKISLKVTRKDGYYLDDLTDALKESSDTVDITLKDGDKLSSNMVQSIKGSGKKVNLNYYDNNKKLLYTWMVDGSKIENTNSFLTKVSASDGENSVVKKLVNNVDGTLITLDNKDLLPKGTMLKYYVGDKYKNGDVVNVYYHNLYDEKLDEVGSKLVVKDGYVTFNTSKGSDYFVTLDNLGNESEVTTTGTKKSINIFLIISIIEFIVIIGLLVYFLKFRDKNK